MAHFRGFKHTILKYLALSEFLGYRIEILNIGLD